MSFNLDETILAYTKKLSEFTDEIILDSNISAYEQLDILSTISNSFDLIKNVVSTKFISFKTIEISISDKHLTEKNSYNNLTIQLNINDKDYYPYVLHSIGSYIYYDILKSSSTSTKKDLMQLCEKLIDIILSKSEGTLNTLSLYNSEKGNLLQLLTSGKNLFSRGFLAHTLYSSNITEIEIGSLDYSVQDYNMLKNDFKILLTNYRNEKPLNKIKPTNEEFKLNLDDKEIILLNEERIFNKCKALNDISKTNTEIISRFCLENYMKNENLEFKNIDYLEDIALDEEEVNFKDYKELMNALDSKNICDLEYTLENDIQLLSSLISTNDTEINILKSKLAHKKQSDYQKELDILFRLNFFLTQEQRMKIKMKRALESAEITYTEEHIDILELKDKKRKIKKNILEKNNEQLKNKDTTSIDVSKIKDSIVKVFGLSPTDIENSLLQIDSISKIKLKPTKNNKIKKSFVQSKTEDFIAIYEPSKEMTNNTPVVEGKDLDLNSDEFINSLIKKKLHSVYTNSSSKFRNSEYNKINKSHKTQETDLNLSPVDRLLNNLINEADKLSKNKQNTKNINSTEKEKQNTTDMEVN